MCYGLYVSAMSSLSMDCPVKNTGVGFHSLQGIFPIWGWNPGICHCRQIFYHLSCQPGMIEIRVMVTVKLLWRAKRKTSGVVVIFHILWYAHRIYLQIFIRLNKYHVFPLVYASYNYNFLKNDFFSIYSFI